MAIKHNQQIPNGHFHKDWQRRVRVHFDQPGRKKRRRNARVAKAAQVAPRPVDKLRPIVRCPTIKYNRRVRPGRGFSLAELKAAGIPRKFAPTIGIAVDPRRQNLSEESLKANVERLEAYRQRVIIFPRRVGRHKKGDASAEEVAAIKKATVEGHSHPTNYSKTTASLLPITNVAEFREGKLSDFPGEENAYKRLRTARSDARLIGVREKRAKSKVEEATTAAKK